MIGSATLCPLAFSLFLDPLPVWDNWPWLLIPLTIGVSIVYKSIKCKSMATVPREAAGITFWILGGMMLAAGVLWGVVEFLGWV
jgi:hypothetical protein